MILKSRLILFIYELSEKPRFIIAPGKPHETEYLELNW